MVSALACALIQQWCREYLKYAYPRAAPHKLGRVRTYMLQGLNQFHMTRFMYAVHVMLHISMFVFFCGVSDYLNAVYPTVGLISRYCVVALAVVYTVLSIFPFIIGNCPYQTALTPPLRFGGRLLLFLARHVRWWFKFWCGQPGGTFPQCKDLHFDKIHSLVEAADKRAAHLDPYALTWLFTDNDFVDTDIDQFLEGLPGYVRSYVTVKEDLPKGITEVLTARYFLRRIREHLMTCATATELSEQARIKRVSACVDSLREILRYQTCAEGHPENSDKSEFFRCYMQSIVDGLNTLCKESDKIASLRAPCVRALVFQGLLTKCLEPVNKSSPNGKFPGHFIPLYKFFSSPGNLSRTQQQETESLSAKVLDETAIPDDYEKIWQTVLHDGPLVNLTLLSHVSLSKDNVDPISLSLMWKTLDMLRSELRITRVNVSDASLILFNEVHKETRRRVEDEEPGLVPLLEILDAVARGRRLSMVFRDHDKYHSKADLVFGKDHLRNAELFRAFANCLPDFVVKNPGKSMVFMEDLVCHDYLWTTLQVNLWNSLRSDRPIPAKLRFFDTCCTVIDAVFLALGNSQKVDWRTPDLGPLAHHFELFVTDCFQGIFIERSIGFRVGLIKARFCNDVLAQFLEEFAREGTIIFRSQWDVASLARLFYSLRVGDDADVEFWQAFVDGGPIGVEFMARAHATLERAARDGPLLNFCKLGHLAIMAVPFEESGLEDTDLKKLLGLMKKMANGSHLPTLASTQVWEDLGRLRHDVTEIHARSEKKDKEFMGDLLVKIEGAYGCRSSSTQEHGPSDLVQVQVPGTSVVVQPNLSPSNELRRGNDRSSSSTSTTLFDDLHDSSPAREDGSGGMVFPLSWNPCLMCPCHLNLLGITTAPLNNSRGEFANIYRTPYPLLPSQFGPGGASVYPFFTSSPTLFPLSEITDLASPNIPSIPPSFLHMRHNAQHHHAPGYYPPRRDISNTLTNNSATRSTLVLSSRVPLL